MSSPTHTVRLRTGGPAEHVTEEQVAQMRQSFGERHFAANYVVEPLADKPAALPVVASGEGAPLPNVSQELRTAPPVGVPDYQRDETED